MRLNAGKSPATLFRSGMRPVSGALFLCLTRVGMMQKPTVEIVEPGPDWSPSDDEPPVRITLPAALPSKETLGDLLAAFLPETTPEEDAAWEAIEAAVDLIACHYALDRDEVWGTVVGIEAETYAETGCRNLGHVLDTPAGFARLGERVAYLMLGDEAEGLPSINMATH